MNKKITKEIEEKPQLDGFDEIEWGRKPKLDSKEYSFEHLIIKNRFDFGGDAQSIVQHYDPASQSPEYYLCKNSAAKKARK